MPQNMAKPKNKLNRLTSASLDLEKCISFVDELDKHSYGSIPYEGILISSIIFYSRPFSENEKKNSPHPSDSKVPESVLLGLSQCESDIHKSIITLRNKAVAHAEWGYHPTGISDGIIVGMPFSIWKHFNGQKELSAFKLLACKVRNAVQHEQANELRNYSN